MGTIDPGATTFGELVTEIVGDLQGFVRDQEAATHLTAAIDADDLTISVADVAIGGGVGVIEIDDELLWVQQVDRTTNTITVAPYGRGHKNTTAASHLQNARVTFGPRSPRFTVMREVNQQLAAMGDQLPVVATTTITADVATTYALPATVRTVVDARWQSIGPSERWEPVRHWNLNTKANTTEWPTGVTIDILDSMTLGQTVQIVYFKSPTLFSATSDPFTASGYAASVLDVVKYGVLSRMVSKVEAARLDYKSIEADQLDGPTPMGSGTALSKHFQQMYLMRLDEERQRLLERVQPRIRRAY